MARGGVSGWSRARVVAVALVVAVVLVPTFVLDQLIFGIGANGVHFNLAGVTDPQRIISTALGVPPPNHLRVCFNVTEVRSNAYSATMFACANPEVASPEGKLCPPIVASTHVTRLGPFLPSTAVLLFRVVGRPESIDRAVAALRVAAKWSDAEIDRWGGAGARSNPFFSDPSQTIESVTCEGYGIIKIERGL